MPFFMANYSLVEAAPVVGSPAIAWNPGLDGGDATTVSYSYTADGGDATTASYSTTWDGGDSAASP